MIAISKLFLLAQRKVRSETISHEMIRLRIIKPKKKKIFVVIKEKKTNHTKCQLFTPCHVSDLILTSIFSSLLPPLATFRIPQPSHVGVWRSLNDAEQ